MLTQASIRLRSIRRFDRSASRLQAELGRADGLRAVVGVGDVPIVRLGTASVWESIDAARRASGAWAAHAAARDAAAGEEWFAESLFATFAPIRSWGTWSGRDPLAPQHA